MMWRGGLLGALWRTLQWQVDDQVQKYRGNSDTTHGLPECGSVYGVKRCLEIHECGIQRLLKFSVDFRQQAQCQDCIQCRATTAESKLVGSSMVLKQRVKSGKEDMGKYLAWD